jgi:hypothetical protein
VTAVTQAVLIANDCDGQRAQQCARQRRSPPEGVVDPLGFGWRRVVGQFETLTKDAEGKKTTPAMAAGVADRVWTHHDIAALLD